MGVTLSPVGTSATIWPIVPASDDDDDEYETVGGMRTDKEKFPSAALSTTNPT
jgi:hypothetical protein